MTKSRLKMHMVFVVATALIMGSGIPASAMRSPAASPVQRAAPIMGVQERTADAILLAYQRKDFSRFDSIEGALKAVDVSDSPALTHLRDYWLGYLYYQEALSLMRSGDRDRAKPVLQRSIATLGNSGRSDTEVNALLGLATGLNLQYVPKQSIMNAVQDTNGHLAAALSNKPSLRAYYASAVADFNTPAMYGGKRKAEGLVRQALSQAEPAASQLRPTWGRDLATALLVRILLSDKKKDQAVALYRAARRDFPNSVAIDELKTNF